MFVPETRGKRAKNAQIRPRITHKQRPGRCFLLTIENRAFVPPRKNGCGGLGEGYPTPFAPAPAPGSLGPRPLLVRGAGARGKLPPAENNWRGGIPPLSAPAPAGGGLSGAGDRVGVCRGRVAPGGGCVPRAIGWPGGAPAPRWRGSSQPRAPPPCGGNGSPPRQSLPLAKFPPCPCRHAGAGPSLSDGGPARGRAIRQGPDTFPSTGRNEYPMKKPSELRAMLAKKMERAASDLRHVPAPDECTEVDVSLFQELLRDAERIKEFQDHFEAMPHLTCTATRVDRLIHLEKLEKLILAEI